MEVIEISFNSSVGILVVRTKFVAVVVSAEIVVSIPRSEFWSFGRDYQLNTITSSWLFQFLGRNSGRSDLLDNGAFEGEQVVSIPRSEFWSFGRYDVDVVNVGPYCFNSSVGILVVRTTPSMCHGVVLFGFNSSVGILVVRTYTLSPKRSIRVSFNSSVGILVVRTLARFAPPRGF